jgi:hypothetical protein
VKLLPPWIWLIACSDVDRVIMADVRGSRLTILSEIAPGLFAAGAATFTAENIGPAKDAIPVEGYGYLATSTSYAIIGVPLAEAVLALAPNDAVPTGVYDLPEVKAALEAYGARERDNLERDPAFRRMYSEWTRARLGAAKMSERPS